MLDELQEPDWVAERPEDHLQPHLIEACSRQGAPWALASAVADDDVFLVELSCYRPGGRLRDLRADAFALIGAIAESATFVHQRVVGDIVEYRMVTGMLDADGPFQSHGHTMIFRVSMTSYTDA